MDDFAEIKRQAKALYLNIGRVWCPALNDYVVFNQSGFRHLIRKNTKRRSLSEQKRRFLLLPRAKDIITNPNSKLFYKEGGTTYLTKRHGEKTILKPRADFWTLRNLHEDIVVTVIIRQLETKQKHFFSIYDERYKKSKTVGDG